MTFEAPDSGDPKAVAASPAPSPAKPARAWSWAGAGAFRHRFAAPWISYPVAVLATLATLGARLAMGFGFDSTPRLVMFVAPVLIGGYLGGFGPALVATVLGPVLANLFILQPHGSLWIGRETDFWNLLWLCAVGLLAGGICEAMHKARRRVEASQSRIAVTLASIGDGVITVDRDNRVAFVNRRAEMLTGWDSSAALGQPLGHVFPIIDEASREPPIDPDSPVLDYGDAQNLSKRTLLLARDGREIPIDHTTAPIREPDGAVTGAVLVFRDCSARRRGEQALRRQIELQDRAAMVASSAPGIVLSFRLRPDGSTSIPYASAVMADLMGFEPDELVEDASPFWATIHPDDAVPFRAAILDSAVNRAPFHFEFRLQHPSRGERWIEVRSLPQAEPDGSTLWHGYADDVTDRKRAQQTIRDNEQRLRAALTGPGVGVVEQDLDLRYTWLEIPPTLAMAPGLLGQTDMDIVGHDQPMIALKRGVIASNQGARGEIEVVTPTGTRWFDLSVEPRRDASGAVTGIITAMMDITIRKVSEEEVRAAANRLRVALGGARVAVAEQDLDLRYSWIETPPSPQMVTDVIGKTDIELWGPDHPAVLLKQRVARDRVGARQEIAFRLPSGDRWYDLAVEPRLDASGEVIGTISSATDVTERKRTWEQLRQAQKMEAIGNLTGGMAHDFNNLLSVITGNVDLAIMRIRSADTRELLTESMAAAWRGAELTRRLLAFARRQPLQPALVFPHDLVTTVAQLLSRTLGEDIEIALDVSSEEWPVIVDPAQLEVALVNLATNSRDAMPHGGLLRISTANVQVGAEFAVAADIAAGDYATIQVTDTGTGMTPEVMQRLFEPFYTTKGPGKGTGLGLSMVFGFIKQSGGHVTVESQPGAGTTFRLYLPRCSTQPQARIDAGSTALRRGDGERILVVEDALALRRLVVNQLHGLGYRPCEADSALDALDIIRTEPVDLLFSDIVMPGPMNGTELAKAALDVRPELKILLTSGYPGTPSDWPVARRSPIRLLTKPYTREVLSRVLRQVLDQES